MNTEPLQREDGGAPAPPSFTSGSNNRNLKIAGIALLLLGLLLVGLAVAGVFSDDEKEAPRRGDDAAMRGMTEHVNRKGGYSFSYPDEWRLKDKGRTSTVTAPGKAQIISFGPAPDGSLRAAARRFLASIVESYTDPSLGGAELDQLDGHQALLVSGEAENDDGVSLRFLTVTIATDRANYGIVVYTDAAADPFEALPVMERIVGSFHITR